MTDENKKLQDENKKLNNEKQAISKNLNEYKTSYNDAIEEDYILRECNCCGAKLPFFAPFRGRLHAQCPKCYALERTRLVSYYFKNHTEVYTKEIKLLHFGPETTFYNTFSQCDNIDYYPVDICENKRIRLIVDMCDIPFEDNTFDYIFASHVMEHIPDDIQAMSELYRTVKPSSEGGKVLLMIPLFKTLEKTFENPEYDTPELRLKYFGQEDHVRKYSWDFIDRLESVGFKVTTFTPQNVDKKTAIKYGFPTPSPDTDAETVFVCEK